MAEMLLINPRKRRAARKTSKRRTAKRRRNPINTIRSRSVAPRRAASARRSNPIRYVKRRMSRRRRNPINLGGSAKSFMTHLRDALIGGAGAIAVDVAYARIAPMLPATLQPVPGSVGAGDAVKALVTVLLGRVLSKPTKGLSTKLAHGALTVQAHGIMKAVLPAAVTGGMGYYSPAQIADMSARVGPIRRGMSAYVPGTQLLNAYTRAGSGSPVLGASPRVREGVTVR